MDHDRAMWFVILADILELETLREIEIKLHGGQLPRPTDSIFNPNVYLWTIEDGFSFHTLVRNASLVQSSYQRFHRAIPVFIRAKIVSVCVITSYRKLHPDVL